nr:UPF0147 family protein [Methanothrix sp.]
MQNTKLRRGLILNPFAAPENATVVIFIMSEKVIKQCVEILERIMSDDTVPRNIRRSAENVKGILLQEGLAEAVKAASAISILDEISNDPNIPLHTRTLIWNVASQLETIPVS